MLETVVGYCGGIEPDPTYDEIKDHSEAIRVVFDPRVLSYETLLRKHFWPAHTPRPVARRAQQESPVAFKRRTFGGSTRSAVFTHGRGQAVAATKVQTGLVREADRAQRAASAASADGDEAALSNGPVVGRAGYSAYSVYGRRGRRSGSGAVAQHTAIEPCGQFYRAEEHHQKWIENGDRKRAARAEAEARRRKG